MTISIKNALEFGKALVRILRHKALEAGIPIGPDGFVYWVDILKLGQFKGLTGSQIEWIVDKDSKQRFMLKTDPNTETMMIRCNQGHSFPEGTIDPDKLLTQITAATVANYLFVVHGCPTAAWWLIQKTGLNKMGRQHVHMAVGLPESGNVISGMRNSSEVTIEIDLPAALAAGIPFYVSANNVILSPGPIPPLFFKKVIERQSGMVLFPLPSCEHPCCENLPTEEVGLCDAHKYCDCEECMTSVKEGTDFCDAHKSCTQ
jgi:2'-phosphotransferase